MPRHGPPRAVTHERNLAARIAYEREQRDWTYETVARRMGEHGCPVQASAVFKIEKGNPPRRINVDEFMTFAQVFDIEPMDLLRHPDEVRDARLASVFEELRRADEQVQPVLAALEAKIESALREVESRPETTLVVLPTLEDVASRTSRFVFPPLYERLRTAVDAAASTDMPQGPDSTGTDREG